MSVLDQFTFKRSLEVLNSPSLVSLLSCSLCSQTLSTTTTLSTGQCHHALCQDCLKSHPGGVCPVEGCSIPAHPKDYTENRTLGQLAVCLSNIRTLLDNKENDGGNSVKVNTSNVTSDKETSVLTSVTNNLTLEVKEKMEPSKLDKMRKEKRISPGIGKRRANRISKTVMNEDRAPALLENQENVHKRDFSNNSKGESVKNNVTTKVDSKDMSEESPLPAMKAPSNKKQSRLSLPEGKKVKTSRVRSATTSDQSVPLINTTLNSSVNTAVVSLEKKNKKGETMLHTACVKGCLDTVKSLISQGAILNTQDNAGWTPLHEAAGMGRLDIARVLLEAGARPSVPSKEDKVTALHDAVGSGQVEMVKLLVSRGANRDARDSKGKTPRDMAEKLGSIVKEVLENTVVEVQVEDFMESILQPQDIVMCLDKQVSENNKLTKTLTDMATKLGCKKPSSQVRDDMTHMLVDIEDDEKISSNVLIALLLGAKIVKTSWLMESLKQGKVLNCLQYRCKINGKEGAKKGKVRRACNQPGLFDGLHFYLSGTFEPPCLTKAEVQNIVKMGGGKLLSREPDPEFIPSQEDTVPYHAPTSSSIASTSHVILYMLGGKREPMIKYNMKHVKTLPVSWLLSCITSGSVVDPLNMD